MLYIGDGIVNVVQIEIDIIIWLGVGIKVE